jgi:anti-anti-sigma factor
MRHPVERNALQPSARDLATAEVVAMMHDSIRHFVGKNTPDVYFALYDDFDICNKPQLSAALEESVGYRTITIDLAQTTFIDASILGVFVRLSGRCRKHNAGHVRIVNANSHLRKLFSICELENVFGIEDRPAHSDTPRRSVGFISPDAPH